MGRDKVRIYKSGIHTGEEKIIVGNDAAGMVNFSGCHLACNFCYTPETSVHFVGEDYDESDFGKLLEHLAARGAKNINLISPTHVWSRVEAAVKGFRTLPHVLKISGYESANLIRRMAERADVFVPDFKVYSDKAAASVNLPANYGETTEKALAEMLKTHGETQFSESGQIARGVLIRHLIMPGFLNDSIQVIEALGRIGYKGVLNLMTYFISPGRGLQIAFDFETELLKLNAKSLGMTVLVNGKAEVRHANVA